jgi:hypothetical protein
MNDLLAPTVQFVTVELIPTLVALFGAAAREPMSWGVAAAALAARSFWRRLQRDRD